MVTAGHVDLAVVWSPDEDFAGADCLLRSEPVVTALPGDDPIADADVVEPDDLDGTFMTLTESAADVALSA